MISRKHRNLRTTRTAFFGLRWSTCSQSSKDIEKGYHTTAVVPLAALHLLELAVHRPLRLTSAAATISSLSFLSLEVYQAHKSSTTAHFHKRTRRERDPLLRGVTRFLIRSPAWCRGNRLEVLARKPIHTKMKRLACYLLWASPLLLPGHPPPPRTVPLPRIWPVSSVHRSCRA